MKPTPILLALLAASSLPAAAQVWDTSGNGKLSGKYYFREVIFTSSESIALYGGMTFGGNGTYSINAAGFECDQSGSCSGPSPFTPSNGTYSLAASGFGFLSHPLLSGDSVYGSVGANGVFVGSSTENGTNDLFIAAPISGQSVATLNGNYSLAYIYPGGQTPYDALVQMTPNGAGNIGTVSLSAYATSSSALTQSISGIKYIVSNNAFVLTFPNSNSNLIVGQEYLYSTPDGSFVFGGSPQDFDMFVGVRKDSSASNFGGLYYEAGFDVDNSQLESTGYSYLDTFYGSFNAANGVILGHQRIQPGQTTGYSYTYSDSYPTTSGGTYTNTSTGAQFVAGSSGAIQIGLGVGPSLGISVGFRAPTFSGSGVYLNPVGVVNSASYAPFTAGVARGEYLTLVGTNLGPDQLQVASTVPFPTTLAGVQVLINNIPAPIYYVSSTQISAIVPYLTTAAIAQIQVVNNGASSNVVTEFVNATTPGVFSQQADGIGYAAAEHDDGSLVTASNPLKIGESVSVYVTGLGDVSPSVADGNPAPTTPLSNTTNTITAAIGGVSAPVYYAGLAPGFIALYQVNLGVPTGLTNGDNYLDLSGPDAYSSEALLSITGGTAATTTSATKSLRSRPNILRRAGRRRSHLSLRDRARLR